MSASNSFKKEVLYLLAGFCIAVVCAEESINIRKKEKEILDTLFDQYDSRILPHGQNHSDGPVNTVVNMFIRSMKMNEDDNELTTQITLRMQWNDDRMKYNDNNGRIRRIKFTEPSRVWMPDIFFANELRGKFHNILMPNVLLSIHPNGDLLFSIRVTLVLSCEMNFKSFPMDQQQCAIILSSYSYTEDEVIFNWRTGDPVQFAKNIKLPSLNLVSFKTASCSSRTNTGVYSCKKVLLDFTRDFSYYFYFVYTPSIFIILMSWIAFWLDSRCYIMKSLLVLISIILLILQAKTGWKPTVSYMTALDVWNASCLSFAIAALLQVALTNTLMVSSNDSKIGQEEIEYEPNSKSKERGFCGGSLSGQ